MPGPAADPLVRVRRMRVGYAVPRGHPDPESTRARLTPALEQAVPKALLDAALELSRAGGGPLAGSASQPEDEGVWLIRRLELDLAVHTGWHPDAIARAWAPRIARTLLRAIEDGGDGVRHFGRRSDHLARFLTEVVAGTAWDRWYLRAFAPLRPLPRSVAIRLALSDDPAVGFEALVALAPTTLQDLVAVLDGGDARRTLDALAGDPSEPLTAALVAAAAQAQVAVGQAPAGAVEEARLALRLAAELGRGQAARPGRGSARAARAVARLARLAGGDAAPAAAAMRAIRTGDATRLGALIADPDPGAAAAVAAGVAGWRPAGVAATMAHDAGGPADPDEATVRHTRFGALFLLLESLAALPLDRMCAGWPTCGSHTAAATVRLLVALRCLGAPGAALADPVVLDTLGIDPVLDVAELDAWQRSLRPAHVRRLAALAATPPHAIAEPAGMLATAAGRSGRVALLVDAETATWLGARAWRRDRAAAVRHWAQRVTPGSVDPKTLTLQGDFDHVEPPPQLLGTPAADLQLRVLAQRCLRSVAQRLPGFARTSLAHLHRNVLDVPARVEQHEDRIIVILGRPPLDVLLSMTAMSRATVRAPWRADGRPFVLFPEAAA